MPRMLQTPVRNAGDARVAAAAASSAQPRNVAGVRRKSYGTGKPHRFRPGTQALRQIR
jgi:hypothetical protein